jgi:hypothetical protein
MGITIEAACYQKGAGGVKCQGGDGIGVRPR